MDGGSDHSKTGQHAEADRRALAGGARLLLRLHMIASGGRVMSAVHCHGVRRGHCHRARLGSKRERHRDKGAEQATQGESLRPHSGSVRLANNDFKEHNAAANRGTRSPAAAIFRVAHGWLPKERSGRDTAP